MKKIITALGNNRLNEELRKTNKYEIVAKDVSYTEGILEILEEFPKVDMIIISEILEGELSFKELINEIIRIRENVDIIVFVEEKTPELQNFLFRNGIYKIYSNNEIEIDKFIESLQDKSEEKVEFLTQELTEIRKHINKEFQKANFEARGKIIALTGTYNSGKSTLACVLAKEYANLNKKTLIIDFDIYNSSISTLLKVQKYNNKGTAFNIKAQTIHIGENQDVICAMDLLFNNDNTVDYMNLEEMLQDFRIEYDIIIIDTTSNYQYKYLSRILNDANYILYCTVPSVVELEKSVNLLEVLLEDFKINKNKLKIILNKVNTVSVDKEMISKKMEEIVVSGIINYDKNIEINIMQKKPNQKININEMIGG